MPENTQPKPSKGHPSQQLPFFDPHQSAPSTSSTPFTYQDLPVDLNQTFGQLWQHPVGTFAMPRTFSPLSSRSSSLPSTPNMPLLGIPISQNPQTDTTVFRSTPSTKKMVNTQGSKWTEEEMMFLALTMKKHYLNQNMGVNDEEVRGKSGEAAATAIYEEFKSRFPSTRRTKDSVISKMSSLKSYHHFIYRFNNGTVKGSTGRGNFFDEPLAHQRSMVKEQSNNVTIIPESVYKELNDFLFDAPVLNREQQVNTGIEHDSDSSDDSASRQGRPTKKIKVKQEKEEAVIMEQLLGNQLEVLEFQREMYAKSQEREDRREEQIKTMCSSMNALANALVGFLQKQ